MSFSTPRAASGGGSSEPIRPVPESLEKLGFSSTQQVYASAMRFLDEGKEVSERGLKNLIHIGEAAPLDPVLVALFFKTAIEESKFHSPEQQAHLRREMRRIDPLISIPVILKSSEGSSRVITLPLDFCFDSGYLRDHFEYYLPGRDPRAGGGGAAGGAGSSSEGLVIELPDRVTEENFEQLLNFYRTKTLPDSFEDQCALLWISDYLMAPTVSDAIVNSILEKNSSMTSPSELLSCYRIAARLATASPFYFVKVAENLFLNFFTRYVNTSEKTLREILERELSPDELIELQASSRLLPVSLTLSSPTFSDDQLEEICQLFPMMKALGLTGSNLTDAGVASLAPLTNLTALNIAGCSQITNIASLAHLINLTELNLADCDRIADEGFASLAHLINLTELNLINSNITDVGLRHLMGLSKLRNLNILFCLLLTDEAISAFRTAHPGIAIADKFPP